MASMTVAMHSVHWPFYAKDWTVWTNLGEHFVVRLVIRLFYKDEHKAYYVSRHAIFRSASLYVLVFIPRETYIKPDEPQISARPSWQVCPDNGT